MLHFFGYFDKKCLCSKRANFRTQNPKRTLRETPSSAESRLIFARQQKNGAAYFVIP
jgi:hypothetical protein